MTVAISFLPPIFGDEYDGVKMRFLVAELERLHAEIVRSLGLDVEAGIPSQEINDLSVIVTWANVPLANIPNLPTSRITSGTFVDARIAQSNVTQHEAALTILESQITDANILARIGGNESITGSWTFSNNLTRITGTAIQLRFLETGGTLNEGAWRFLVNTDQFLFGTLADDETGGNPIFIVTRTATVPDKITFSLDAQIAGALTATSYEGIAAANILSRAVAENITAIWDFTTNPKIDAAGIDTGTFANARIAVGNVTQHEASIDHDALTNFLTGEHYLQSAIAITAAQVTSLTFADALIAQSNVTQHEAAIDHDALTNFLTAEHVDWAGASAGTIHTTNFTALQNIVEDTTPQLGGNLASNGSDILMADNDQIKLGTGADGTLQFVSASNEVRITNLGTTSFAVLLNATETAILAQANAAVTLYYNGLQKLVTASDGIDVTGDVGGTTIGGIVQDKLVAKDAPETIAAIWDFTTNPKIDAAGIDTGTFANARIAVGNVTQHEASIDHDALTNFVSGEHFLQSAISITGAQVTAGTFPGDMKFDGEILMAERAGNPVGESAFGVLWVKNTVPNQLWFTDDASVDIQISGGGDLVNDTSPQLGANLASNGFDILMADGDKVIFGDAGDMQMFNNAGTATSTISNLLANAILDFTFASSNKISFDGANKRVDIRDGWTLRIRNSGDVDFADFSHDGTDFNTALTNTIDWNITGITSLRIGGVAVATLNTNWNAADITAGTLLVARGGTGVTTKTGTGANVQAVSPALTGTPTSGGSALATLLTNWAATDITSGTLLVARGGTGVTSKTGTGSVVLSASPTFTGTPVFANLRINTNLDLNGNINGDGASIIDGIETIKIDATGDITKVSHGNYLYHQSTVYDDDQEGGITFSTSAASGGADGDIWFRYTA